MYYDYDLEEMTWWEPWADGEEPDEQLLFDAEGKFVCLRFQLERAIELIEQNPRHMRPMAPVKFIRLNAGLRWPDEWGLFRPLRKKPEVKAWNKKPPKSRCEIRIEVVRFIRTFIVGEMKWGRIGSRTGDTVLDWDVDPRSLRRRLGLSGEIKTYTAEDFGGTPTPSPSQTRQAKSPRVVRPSPVARSQLYRDAIVRLHQLSNGKPFLATQRYFQRLGHDHNTLQAIRRAARDSGHLTTSGKTAGMRYVWTDLGREYVQQCLEEQAQMGAE